MPRLSSPSCNSSGFFPQALRVTLPFLSLTSKRPSRAPSRALTPIEPLFTVAAAAGVLPSGFSPVRLSPEVTQVRHGATLGIIHTIKIVADDLTSRDVQCVYQLMTAWLPCPRVVITNHSSSHSSSTISRNSLLWDLTRCHVLLVPLLPLLSSPLFRFFLLILFTEYSVASSSLQACLEDLHLHFPGVHTFLYKSLPFTS